MHQSNNNDKVLQKVWDLPTRLYHWLQAFLLLGALLTGFFAPEWWLDGHVALGYGLALLLLFRLVWGFLGSQHSRFSDFIYSPAQLGHHLVRLLRGRPGRFVGHNPAGAAMVFAIWLAIAFALVSGLFVLGGEENQGALAGFVSYATGSAAKTAHLLVAYALVGMATLHVLGVIVDGRMTGEPLVRAMITGNKPVHPSLSLKQSRAPRARLASLTTVTAASALVAAGWAAANRPASGLAQLPPSPTYQSECSACHIAYHPSLLPRASWTGLMGELENHFGEDASLDAATTGEITQWLQRYAAQAWDTEAANRMSIVDPASPFSITATPYWRQKHAGVDPTMFTRPPIGAKANCAACHAGAARGYFGDD